MSAPLSIADRSVRVYVQSLVGLASVIVVVGTAAAAGVVIRRDDGGATALARTLGSELTTHASDTPEELDELVRHELEEQRWFHRRIEVWRNGARIGRGSDPSVLQGFASETGCRSRVVGERWSRTCSVPVDLRTTIVVATPLAPMLNALAPISGALAVVALVAAVAMTLAGRLFMRRVLRPLARFEHAMSELPALGRDRRIAGSWGALEIDILADTFNALLARIDAAVVREQRFVADAAHELRSPITRLRGQLELASDAMEREEVTSRIGLALRTCSELSRTTEALLALARDEARLADTIDLADIARTVLDGVALEELARIESRFDDDALVRGDESLLGLAVSNLLDNALKYTWGPIAFHVFAEHGARVVVVEDRGDGIPPDELATVRVRFVRGRTRSANVRGSGLGLALVDHVAVLHGGSLTLEPVAPRGLRASLRLPEWRPLP